MNYERSRNNVRNNESGFDAVASVAKKETWLDHLKKAKDLLKRKSNVGEKTKRGFYRLVDHMSRGEEPLREIYESWDDCGIEIPAELGEMVEKYVKSPDWQFGIHRSDAVDGQNYTKDVVLRSIMTEGLRNAGDASSGAIYRDPSVNKTVSFCPDMLHAVIQMKGQYKGSTGAVLVAIPSKYVNSEGEIREGMSGKVYDYNEAGYSI